MSLIDMDQGAEAHRRASAAAGAMQAIRGNGSVLVPAGPGRLDPKRAPPRCGAARWIKSAHGIDSVKTPWRTKLGVPLPLGVHERGDGYNFAVFSRHATRVRLQLFLDARDSMPVETIDLHRSGDIWHVWVSGIRLGQAYAYRADGPYEPRQGHRFNPHKLLLDPNATALAATEIWDFAAARGGDPPPRRRDLSPSTHDNAARTPKCLVVTDHFDWQGDDPPRRPWTDTIIYESHVRGLTAHPSSGVSHPGTFLGVVEKIPYMKELGVTALELMPVQEFNERELTRRDSRTGELLRNYWGYSTVAFFAPKESYAGAPGAGGQLREFKTMVRELHKAGIEIVLDVVFNHTAEGDETGPTINFRGLDNVTYYMLATDACHYQNYTGCGNTLNSRHPVVQDYVLNCLRYWVIEMHVDGFRFDLASALARDADGRLLPNPPLLERIAEDPILRDVKLIAEAWDAGGAYQVGSFPGQRWSEWNAAFRDDVRRFWRGDAGMAGRFASRLCGSADIYERGGERPINSINYVTCHDGFTLNDLVSYRAKNNWANGEDNRDGWDENFSENYGVEGPTDGGPLDALRLRQMKNMLATLMLSRGVPMLLGGDEFRRTQGGNNNAYCQDNATSWCDWALVERNVELVRFVRGLIDFRRSHHVLRADAFYTWQEVSWYAQHGEPARWRAEDRSLACLIAPGDDPALFLAFNAATEAAAFRLPRPPAGQRWQIAIDTAAEASGDVVAPPTTPLFDSGQTLCVPPRSLVVLVAHLA
jgi:isoamylase